MKKIYSYHLAGLVSLCALFSACQKELPKTCITSGTAGTVIPLSTSIVLKKSKNSGGDTSVVFTVTKANYGSSLAVTNVLQFDSMGVDILPLTSKGLPLIASDAPDGE